MDLGLQGRVSLVTGATAGIGRGVAVMLAVEGAQTILVARRGELLEELAQQIVAAGGLEPLTVVADLTDIDAPGRVYQTAEKAFGRVDILVNAAGTSTSSFRESMAAETVTGNYIVSEENWQASFAVNFDYIRRLSDACLPGMVERGWGRIVLIGALPEPHRMSVGLPAKVAGRAWMKGLSREVAQYGVTVNSVPVGRILTEQIMERALPTEQDRQAMAQSIPMRRLGEPHEVASAVAFLVSEHGTYITGQGLTVDGGMSMFAFY